MALKAVLVLNRLPDREQAEEIAERTAHEYSDDDQRYVVWYINQELPDWLDVSRGDQLAAYKRDAGPDACYMIVAMCNDEEVDGLYNEK